MRMLRTLAFLVFGLSLVFLAIKDRVGHVSAAGRSAASADTHGDVRGGNWTMQRSDEADKVEFSLIERRNLGRSESESTWPQSAFTGVDFSKPGRQDVHFTIKRDAGTFECEGFLDNGEGAGIFHFQPNPNYAGEMQKIGFSIDEEKQYEMAVQDVSLEFARQMKNEKLADLDADKLIAFRIFGVNSAFIGALRKEGLNIDDSDKLVAFRIHGVSPEMVRSLHQAGYTPSEDTLVAMRIHGATPEWMAELKKDGYDHIDLEKLIAFRIHEIGRAHV